MVRLGSLCVCDPRETRAAILSASFPYPQRVTWGKYNAASLYVDLKIQTVPGVIISTGAGILTRICPEWATIIRVVHGVMVPTA